MNISNQMIALQDHFELEDSKDTAGDGMYLILYRLVFEFILGGKSVVELYESVQHAGNIIPRLYLLITGMNLGL